MSALLEVDDLHVSFATEDGLVKAVDGISFNVQPGKALGVVGESGSGKTVSMLTVMGLTRAENTTISGSARFEGRDLLSLPTTDPSAGWLVPQSSRMEGRWTGSTVLARDFDGALYFREVHPGTGMVPNRAFTVLHAFGFFVDHLIVTALVLIASLVWLMTGLVRFVRRASRSIERYSFARPLDRNEGGESARVGSLSAVREPAVAVALGANVTDLDVGFI